MFSTNPTNPGEDFIMPVVLSIFFGDIGEYCLYTYTHTHTHTHHQPPLRSFA